VKKKEKIKIARYDASAPAKRGLSPDMTFQNKNKTIQRQVIGICPEFRNNVQECAPYYFLLQLRSSAVILPLEHVPKLPATGAANAPVFCKDLLAIFD
jgi:hypothetical protein